MDDTKLPFYNRNNRKREHQIDDHYGKRKKTDDNNFSVPSTSYSNKPQFNKNPTFANDRLKKLRNDIKNDVEPLSKNNNSKVFNFEPPKTNTNYSDRRIIIPSRGRKKFNENVNNDFYKSDNRKNFQIQSTVINKEKDRWELKSKTSPTVTKSPVKINDSNVSVINSFTLNRNNNFNSKKTNQEDIIEVRSENTSSFEYSGRKVFTSNNLYQISVPSTTNINETKIEDKFLFEPPKKINVPENTCHSAANDRLIKLRKNMKYENTSDKNQNSKDLYTNNSSASSTSSNNRLPKIQETFTKKSKPNDDLIFTPPVSNCDKATREFHKIGQNSRDENVFSSSSSNCDTDKIGRYSKDNHVSNETNRLVDSCDKDTFWTNYSKIINLVYEKYYGKQENEGNEDMDWDDDDVFGMKPSENSRNNQKELYIIVDTNIFLDDLTVLAEITCINSSDGVKPIIYVPWMVLNELDFMKDDKKTAPHLKSKVTKAVEFINEKLVDKSRKLIGQNIYDVDQQQNIGKSPDDKIVSCCLQAKTNFENVILLTNDKNLKNKILVNKIPAFSTTEMLNIRQKTDKEKKLKPSISPFKSEIVEKFIKVQKEISECCSFIICECAKETYGVIWRKMGMLRNPPPYTLKVCLEIFKKYWISMFSERFLKQFLTNVDRLEALLNEIDTTKNLRKFDEFVEACISLCVYFKDLQQHEAFVQSIVREIKSITSPI